MKIKARINAHLYRIAANFLNPNTSIEYIAGIRIEKHAKTGVLITVTDGSRFIILHDQNGYLIGDDYMGIVPNVTVNISSDILGQIPKKREKADELGILIDNQTAYLLGEFDSPIDEFEASYPKDQNYPDWREYVPDFDSNPIEFYNAEDLSDFIHATKDLIGTDQFELSFAGKRNGIVIVRILNCETGFFLAIRKNRQINPGLPEFAMNIHKE